MGYWFNNFLQFERKQKGRNRLILNFYNPEGPKSVKVFVNRDVRIPSGFVHNEKSAKLEQIVKESDAGKFPLKRTPFGNFGVYSITLPYEPEVTHQLDKGSFFQLGNYDKLLRFGGFFPERKVSFSPELEARLLNSEGEIQLENLDGMKFGGFQTVEEMRNLPYVIIDIEKPLWKKDKEKKRFEIRERYLKDEKKYNKLAEKTPGDIRRHEKRQRTILRIEQLLTYQTDVGEVKLFEKRYDADISFISTIWNNHEEKIKELYVLDPNNEFLDFKSHRGYNILYFKTEEELVSALNDNYHKRKPVVSFGQNEVYDNTQIRFALENAGKIFDPLVDKIQPRRDLTRKVLQRLGQNLIYVDSYPGAKQRYPYLSQKSFGTSFKLASIAEFLGIDFRKSLTHEELRFVELRRLSGKTFEDRLKAMKEMTEYSAADLDATEQIIHKMDFWPLLVEMKKVLPFCTTTEIAFSTNCMQKLHDYKNFQRVGNLRYYGYKQKEREDELQIFKKRFKSEKREMLNWAFTHFEFSIKPRKGEYEKMHQFYIPLEEWISELTSSNAPELELASKNLKNKHDHFAVLQFKKAYSRDTLADYYFARRDEKNYNFGIKTIKLDSSKLDGHRVEGFFPHLIFSENWQEEAIKLFDEYPKDKENYILKDFVNLEKKVGKQRLDSLVGSFKYLKNHFRSVYVDLPGKDRTAVRDTKKNLENFNYPKIMEKEVDLYLARKEKDFLEKKLTSDRKKVFKKFLTNFETFESMISDIGKEVEAYEPLEFLYSYIQFRRMNTGRYEVYKKNRFTVDELKKKMGDSYLKFADEVIKSAAFIEINGDYLLMSGDKVPDIPSACYVRSFDGYTCD